ncbi:hypothetical protein CASFOL_034771 [Castilleja foliolosa]|uniref:Leucine-rich repeat-containing N-terminal plant-type domain-containing protein n=1 Tax=Castilleja foliolosa TaxID=1961234 RepID=A0ABD3BRG3_9LAMI
MGMMSLLAVVMFIFMIMHPLKCITDDEYAAEGHALLALQSNLNDPMGYLSNWDLNTDHCQWNFTICDEQKFVKSINLQGASLEGHLVADIGTLRHLEYLEHTDVVNEEARPDNEGNFDASEIK